MLTLNLPTFKYKLKNENNKTFIWDVIRRKYIILTPEEWVRQHFIHLLINDLGYSRNLIRCEMGHLQNTLQKRTDLVVFNKEGNAEMLVELKAPSIPLAKDVMNQTLIYNKEINASVIVISNGMQTGCFKKGQNDEWLILTEIPRNKTNE